MTIKLYEIINLNRALKLIIDDNSKKIDSLLKFKLLGIMKSIAPHIENFEIIRNEKIREYGKETEDGGIVISPEDKDSLDKFTNEIKKITDSEVELTIPKLKAQDVFNKGISAELLIVLYPFMDEQ